MNNEILSPKVLHISDLENQKAVEHNDLITSVAKMDKIPLKIFELAVSCLDTENIPQDNTVYLSKETLFSFFDVASSSKHTRFKNVLRNLHEQAIFEVQEVQEKDGKFEYSIISPISRSSWNDYNDSVSIKFTEDIMPYLINLKSNFTQYLITDIMELNSKHSIILYKWFSMYYNQYEKYNENGQRREEQLEQLKNPYVEIQELRRLTNTIKEYELFSNFDKKILKKPIEEINKNTHFTVTYDKIKKGRSIVGIKFYIEKKKTTLAPMEYKLNDPISQKHQQTKEENENQLLGLAMQSPYTKLLLKQLLINQYDLIDKKVMVGLQRTVFPKYEELAKLQGRNSVKEHIQYVAAHKIPSSKKENIA
ncbi:MAG: RepB family plasmid replication initiator protein [Tetragenococcus koreensis]|nr:RepB family plasmid replication initiator protein [Tetragenococcus koreensis]MDN6502752.1 RepB family plasmid replication initiator protein [Tetragenococcus koreensis]MDN6526630.1 RepB family plasmid replication initiator protein [Tetragenococcus halophilus]MDN6580849.1 RepB family plasmid replication initiator protein [Tetragenococcus koreensis]